MVELDARVTHALRWPARWAAPAVVVISAAAWTLGIRGIDHRFISFSDGAYTYIASEAVAHGLHQLYETIVLSQPPAVVLGSRRGGAAHAARARPRARAPPATLGNRRAPRRRRVLREADLASVRAGR